jgi:carboxylesterase
MESGEAFDWAGGSPAVLLLHGFTGTPWEVRPVASALHGDGHACSAPLLPGHGASVSDLARMTWSDWSSAVSDHVTRLVSEHERLVLVGCSLGGLLAVEAAVRFQNRGVVAVCTLGMALSLGAVTDRALRIALALGDRLPDKLVPKTGGSDIQDPAQRAASPAYASYPLRAARHFATGQTRVRALLPSLRVPLLALHGLRDATAPVSSSLELVGSAASADSRLVVLPHAGHLVGVDVDREETLRQIRAFVARVAPVG